MSEKSIFVNKLFLTLSISDFSLYFIVYFFVHSVHPPVNGHPLFPSNSPSPPAERRGAHCVQVIIKS